MSGRTQPPRTRFSRVHSDDPGITIFRVSGSLGPRAKPQLVRLTQECLRRNLPRLVLDLSEVDALGGGTARLLNEFAAERSGRGCKTAFRVTSRTVRGFLCADRHLPPPPLCASLEEAIATVADGAGSGGEPPGSRFHPPASRSGKSAPGDSVRPLSLSASSPLPLSSQRPKGWRDDAGASAGETPERDTAKRDGGLRSLFSRSHEPRDRGGVARTPHKGHGAESAPRRRPAERGEDPFIGSRTPTLDPRAAPASPAPARALAASSTDLRERLLATLRSRGIVSRLFLFEHDIDGRYYLVTRHGTDRERGFETSGGLAGILLSSRMAFLIDVDPDVVNEAETELLAELNCEVAVPMGAEDPPSHLLFLSKEQPGDEFSLEELQEIEATLAEQMADRDHDAVGEPHRAPVYTPPDEAEVSDLFDNETKPRPATGTASAEFLMHDLDRPAPIRVDDPAIAPPLRGTTPEQVRALRRSVAQMRDILGLSHDFDATFGSSKLLEVLVLSVVSVARVETVLYFNAQEGDYVLTHHRGLSSDSVSGLRLRADSSLVERALTSPRGVEIGDSAQITEEERIWARQHGLQFAVPFRYKEETLGLLLLGQTAGDGTPDLEMLGWLLSQAGLAYDRARLYEMLQDRTLGVVRGLITLIEARNAFDCGSTEQVVRYTQALARELQYPNEQLRDLIFGAVLRDVGMLKISESLLRSSSDLTADQWETIRQHPQEGAAIMRQMRFGQAAVDIVLHHHETYNGEGYPMGLRGRAIPLGARVVAVAESYVKMTMDRPYRKALTKPEALESLAENWGLRYDPLVVDALVRVVNRELSLGLKTDRDLTKDLFGV